jgi:hypothetical protein
MQRAQRDTRRQVMLRKLAACVFGSIALIALAASAAPATAAPEPLVIQVMKGQTALTPDGTVLVPIRARCYPPLDAFEIDVSVEQGSSFGSTILGQPEAPLCDGRWHRMVVTVAAETGGFVVGTATVGSFIGAFDPNVGDVDATDDVTVKLK